MKSKIIIICTVLLITIISVSYLAYQDESKTMDQVDESKYTGKSEKFLTTENLFDMYGVEGEDYYVEDSVRYWKSPKFGLKPDIDYSDAINNANTMFIVPLFTASAYESPGFYDYYNDRCDQSCLTAKMQYACRGEASCNGAQVLKLLGYDAFSDVEIDMNPEILNKYDAVIVLHNEYVTQKEFDAITNHPNVLYLYPNANYGLITSDYQTETITLTRGHGYPEKNIVNGFDWKHDNTPMEYDSVCSDWEFYDVDNGKMLNCYPETLILYDMEFLKSIQKITSTIEPDSEE